MQHKTDKVNVHDSHSVAKTLYDFRSHMVIGKTF